MGFVSLRSQLDYLQYSNENPRSHSSVLFALLALISFPALIRTLALIRSQVPPLPPAHPGA